MFSTKGYIKLNHSFFQIIDHGLKKQKKPNTANLQRSLGSDSLKTPSQFRQEKKSKQWCKALISASHFLLQNTYFKSSKVARKTLKHALNWNKKDKYLQASDRYLSIFT